MNDDRFIRIDPETVPGTLIHDLVPVLRAAHPSASRSLAGEKKPENPDEAHAVTGRREPELGIESGTLEPCGD